MVKTISEIEKLIQSVESDKSKSVNTKYLNSAEELKDVLTNKTIKMQYGWVGSREHNSEVVAVGTTAENIMLGELSQFEYLDYGELVDSRQNEVPAHFEAEAAYAVLVKEEDVINYHRDYMHEERYTVYYYNYFSDPEGEVI
ncbi:MAG: hypothetical protein PWQ96_901 [Clostridia bacterium]|nr:hypothetical protein [Clostridia bacterium]